MTQPTTKLSRSSSDLTTFGGLTRSELMSRVRSTGNRTTEGRMVRLLRSSRLTGWRRHARLLGKPDFVWRQAKLALFVDGCFWHGHDCGRSLIPKRNASFWREKIRSNKRRDRRVTRQLRSWGWSVIRVWECELVRCPQKCLRRIRAAHHRSINKNAPLGACK